MCVHVCGEQVMELRRDRLLELALPSRREVTVQLQPSVFGVIVVLERFRYM